jgi:hypothetical protein
MRRAIFAVLAALLVSVAVAGSGLAATSTTFNVRLQAEAAAPDASGHAKLQLFPESGLICYTIRWKDVGAPITGGHIHASPSGAIVVSLFGGPLGTATNYPGDKYTVSDCVTASESTISAILAAPSSYYVNLHVDPVTFTSVLRGQLE